jgi:hypothetical protein
MDLLQHCWSEDVFFGVAQHGAEGPGSVSISNSTAFHYIYVYTHKKVIPNPILAITLNIVRFIIYKTY